MYTPASVSRAMVVGGLAALADDDQHVIGAYDGVPGAELGGVVHLHRNPGDLLQHVLAGQGGMP